MEHVCHSCQICTSPNLKTLTSWTTCSNSWVAFSRSLTQLLIGFAALAVVTEVVFGAEMFPGMTVVDNLTSLITTLNSNGRLSALWPS